VGVYLCDARVCPWYTAAVQNGKAIWSEPYRRIPGSRHLSPLTLGYASPLRESNGRLLGVMNAELTVKDISFYLEKLRVGRTGRAFLIDFKGRLIATSTGVPLVDLANHPMNAVDSNDHHIATAARELEKAFGSFALPLEMAEEVQQNLLPSFTPKIDGLDLAGFSRYCDETTDRFAELRGHDLSLGLTQDVYYREHFFADVRAGQIYLAATDGLWETFNEDGGMFGKKRTRRLIRTHAKRSAAEISREISNEISRFRADAELKDDISYVILKVL